MSFHFVIGFIPRAGKEDDFRSVLGKVVAPTRQEAGCLRMRTFETVTEPVEFAIHSEWTDQIAFDHHIQQAHTMEFIRSAEALLTHPIAGLKLREIHLE